MWCTGLAYEVRKKKKGRRTARRRREWADAKEGVAVVLRAKGPVHAIAQGWIVCYVGDKGAQAKAWAKEVWMRKNVPMVLG